MDKEIDVYKMMRFNTIKLHEAMKLKINSRYFRKLPIGWLILLENNLYIEIDNSC